jgi:hypothetical protein
MRRSAADVGITDVCMPRELAPAAATQRDTSARQHLAYTGRVLIHEGGLVGDAPMLKKPIARPALCARMCVALGLRPDVGERNAC